MEDKKRIVYELISHKDYKPLKIKEISMLLNLSNHDREELEKVLNELIQSGKIIKTKKGKYSLPENLNLLVGKYISHQKGFGFVEIEDREQDIFIPAKYTNGAFHGDMVAVSLLKEASDGKREEGSIVEILSRSKSEIIGTYEKGKSFGFVVPDNKRFSKDIFISKANDLGAVSGH